MHAAEATVTDSNFLSEEFATPFVDSILKKLVGDSDISEAKNRTTVKNQNKINTSTIAVAGVTSLIVKVLSTECSDW